MAEKLPVTVEQLEDGWFLLECPAIQGLMAEGRTVGEALDNLADVARAMYEVCQERGLVFAAGRPALTPDAIIWQIEVPQKAVA
jgi:predicted RNase H-like HicB family nuclease